MKMKMKTRWTRSFTLVELMVVVAVIAVLAGLVLGGAGAVRQRAARGQAKAEVSAIEAGLARYQIDFGSYPSSTGISPSGANYPASPSGYSTAGQVLFTNLWGAATYATPSGGKQYLSVKPSMVNTSGVNYFIDPWGYAYGYYWSGSSSLYGGAVPDVWSTGGQSGTQTNRAKWITSW
jgi:prepilin-type N-terminal cleavage/methylation domain-containing protein